MNIDAVIITQARIVYQHQEYFISILHSTFSLTILKVSTRYFLFIVQSWQYISNLRTKRTSKEDKPLSQHSSESPLKAIYKLQIARLREHKIWWLSYCRASLPLPRTLYSLMEGEESLREQKQKLYGLLYKQMKLRTLVLMADVTDLIFKKISKCMFDEKCYLVGRNWTKTYKSIKNVNIVCLESVRLLQFKPSWGKFLISNYKYNITHTILFI